MDICACGWCGLPVNPGRRFRRGHGKRNRLSHEQLLPIRTAERPDVGCWEIEGYPTKGGYIPLTVAGVIRYAHVVAWEQASGVAVPAGSIICHTCDNPRCWRNDDPGVYIVAGVEYRRFGHLWLGTQGANQRDMFNKGRGNRASGERHPFYGRHTPRPEFCGENHWTHRMPERIARGDRHGSKTKPGKLPTGDAHWTRRHLIPVANQEVF